MIIFHVCLIGISIGITVMFYATDTVGGVVIDVTHLAAVILAGLVYDIRGLGKCVGKVLGSMDRILLSDHGSLKLYLPGALEFLILKGKVERAVLQFLQETVKDSFTGGSGRGGGMTENQGAEGPPLIGCIQTANAVHGTHKGGSFFQKIRNPVCGRRRRIFGNPCKYRGKIALIKLPAC